eukprot:4579329-Prymnesium_polylepis.2
MRPHEVARGHTWGDTASCGLSHVPRIDKLGRLLSQECHPVRVGAIRVAARDHKDSRAARDVVRHVVHLRLCRCVCPRAGWPSGVRP